MNSRVTEDFMLCYARLPANVREQARRAYRLWRSNPSHPGIQFKRIHSAEFELGIGDLQVLYNVNIEAAEVVLLIVGRKVGNALIVENEEFHGHEDDPPESTGIGPQGDAE